MTITQNHINKKRPNSNGLAVLLCYFKKYRTTDILNLHPFTKIIGQFLTWVEKVTVPNQTVRFIF